MNLPTLLSLARVPLVLPAAWLLWRREHIAVAAAFIGAAVATDVLDGFIARRLNAVTALGKKVDPLADKVATAVIGVVLVARYGVPWWLFAAAIARDLAILVAAAVILRSSRRVTQSNVLGKIAAGAMAAYALLVILFPGETVTAVSAWVVLGLILASSAVYAKAFADAMRNRRREP